MRLLTIISLVFLFPFLGLTQNDSIEIRGLVLNLFDGMRQSDTTAMRDCFHEQCNMFTAVGKEGESKLFSSEVADFIKSVGKEHKEIYDERLGSYTIKIDDLLASMEVEYYFFLDDSFSHCGTNFFSFFKSNGQWKIYNIADTRRIENCEVPENTW